MVVQRHPQVFLQREGAGELEQPAEKTASTEPNVSVSETQKHKLKLMLLFTFRKFVHAHNNGGQKDDSFAFPSKPVEQLCSLNETWRFRCY